VALAVQHLCPVRGLWTQAPGPQAVLQTSECGVPLLGQALFLPARDHQKARAVSGLWPLSCAQAPVGLQDGCCHHLCALSGQRPQARDGGARAGPGSCSCTPAPRRNYWHCHSNHQTRNGCTGPRRRRSTSGRPSLHRTHGRWAAGIAQGRLGIGVGYVTQVASVNAAPDIRCLRLTGRALPSLWSTAAPLLGPGSTGHFQDLLTAQMCPQQPPPTEPSLHEDRADIHIQPPAHP
jgi:hypothetical protein